MRMTSTKLNFSDLKLFHRKHLQTCCSRPSFVLQSPLDTVLYSLLNQSCFWYRNWMHDDVIEMLNGPTQCSRLFVIGDSSLAYLTLMNPDTDYKPFFKHKTPALPTLFPHSRCQATTTKWLTLLSSGHVVNIWCDVLLPANKTDTIAVSAEVDTDGCLG